MYDKSQSLLDKNFFTSINDGNTYLAKAKDAMNRVSTDGHLLRSFFFLGITFTQRW
jgi:hypothetical protein